MWPGSISASTAESWTETTSLWALHGRSAPKTRPSSRTSTPIDSIIADSDGIEFDWLVGKGALTYKGSLKFAVCAKQVNGEGKVQHEWHSRIGTGTVYDGIEASAEDIGGFDLRACCRSQAGGAGRGGQR